MARRLHPRPTRPQSSPRPQATLRPAATRAYIAPRTRRQAALRRAFLEEADMSEEADMPEETSLEASPKAEPPATEGSADSEATVTDPAYRSGESPVVKAESPASNEAPLPGATESNVAPTPEPPDQPGETEPPAAAPQPAPLSVDAEGMSDITPSQEYLLCCLAVLNERINGGLGSDIPRDLLHDSTVVFEVSPNSETVLVRVRREWERRSGPVPAAPPH
ncbi:uncharacterized protein BP01DRAFT_384937 [Aspergillus saccharolyticus JOP 1030-1]|uniref:Uncharacterized protein n=1 Tax=Aspergillus saccharolyticus JOP 1030-1 TaxID=1450539 RepID=A0A318Z6R1_9EURO|nr:hypothetical protein BP01DRAFT_384937 [Aspergillus saccharolyticus JOP 1030-1]PYH42991.1 hypothetical protein BP01DRAFT_384937 [Aspergillus saccharolyticus JOP 1030-1]